MTLLTVEYHKNAPHDLVGPSAYAVGNFDGVHRGHQVLLEKVLESAAQKGIGAGVVTFEPHPNLVLRQLAHEPRLTPHEKKIQLLSAHGLSPICIVPFNKELAQMKPEIFVQEVLVGFCKAQHIVVGEDFCFGAGRSGNVDVLKAMGKEAGFQVDSIPLARGDDQDQRLASRTIIQALKAGNVALANAFLGRAYEVSGLVVAGDKRGRQIGFPTANLDVRDYVMPLRGVYAVTAFLQGRPFRAVANIGVRPTFGQVTDVFEVHLFDFDQMIYGECLTVQFHQFIRSEKKFSGIDALVHQMRLDCETAKSVAIS